MYDAKKALALTVLLLLGVITNNNNKPLIARAPPPEKKNNMIEVTKETLMPSKQQLLLYHKGESWQICRFNGFVFVEPLVLLEGESAGLLEENLLAGSRLVEDRGVYVKLQISSKVYANESDAKKESKAQKFDRLDEIIIPIARFTKPTYVIILSDK